jgi:hypothetical protein
MPKTPRTIKTMSEFLESMYVDSSGRKYRAVVTYRKKEQPYITESFDDGKGHSGAFTSEVSLVDLSVFNEAFDKHYITGLVMPGYISQTEFKLTDWGTNALSELRKEAEKRETFKSSLEDGY